MASPSGEKQKLPKFTSNESEDLVKHCKTCETTCTANRQDDQAIWLLYFPATLQGVEIDWYIEIDQASIKTWVTLKAALEEEFKLLCHDNQIVEENYNTKQGKHKNVQACNWRLKELLVKLEKN